MTATGIRLKLVRERLQANTEQLRALRALPQATQEEFLADRRNPDAAESNLRRALEALFDVARHLLSKAYGLGAGFARPHIKRTLDMYRHPDPGCTP